MSSNAATDVCQQGISRCSSWGKYKIRSVADWRDLKLRLHAHAASDFHRLCAAVWKSLRCGLQQSPRALENFKAHTLSAHKAAASTARASEQPAALREAAPAVASSEAGQQAAPSVQAQPAAPNAQRQPAAPSAQKQPPKSRAPGESAESACTLDLAVGSIQDPLRGNVPQRDDWVGVWADSSSVISFRKQEAIQEKRGQPQFERKRKRQMLAVEAEAVRESSRKRLRLATSVSVAFDECDTRKVIRVRCDTQDPPSYQWDGVIGIVRKKYGVTGDTSAELKDDHAVHNLRLLEGTLRAFYTPLPAKLPRKKRNQPAAVVRDSGGTLPARSATLPASGRKRDRRIQWERGCCDEAALQEFRRKVFILASDGGSGERRALFYAARSFFPNARLAIEDVAHGLRIATVKPIQLEGYFSEIQEELINKRHALLPDIQNSGKWKEILHSLQTECLRIPGLRRKGALGRVLHHLAFAKIRMDSTADPLAKLCLMLMPVALLLSFISADERCADAQRHRAQELLSKFQPKFMIGAGVCADWGLICVAFLRLYDRANHDISNSLDELCDFADIINACFIRGGVFCKTPQPNTDGQPAAAARDDGEPAAAGSTTHGQPAAAVFITERVRKQIACKCVFHCGSSDQVVWGPISEDALAELASSSRAAAEAMLERVKAKFGGLRVQFSCFALRRICRALKTENRDRQPRLKEQLLASVKTLGSAFVSDSRILALEYNDALPVALRVYEKALREQRGAPASGGEHISFDNRIVWANFLDRSFLEKNFPTRVAPFAVLPRLLRIWLSALDGECQVERDLGFMRGFQKAFKGRSNDSLLEDLLIIKSAGPRTAEEVGGTFAYRCAEIWRRHYGSAAVHRKRRPPPKIASQPAARRRTCLTGKTFADAKRAVLRASLRAKIPRSGSSMTNFGVTADFFTAPAGDHAAWTVGLKNFHKLTQAYRSKNRMLGRFNRGAFPAFKLRASTDPRQPPDYSRIRILAYLPTHDEAASGAIAAGYEKRHGLHACKTAHMVIVDDLARLHSDRAELEWVLHMLYIVARGLPLTTWATARALRGDMKRVAVTSLREHEPQMIRRVVFLIDRALHGECPVLAAAIKGIAQIPSSAWRVKVTGGVGGQPAAPTGGVGGQPAAPTPKAAVKRRGRPTAAAKEEEVRVPDLASMWAWLRSNRKTVNAKYTRMRCSGDVPSSI